MDKAKRGGVMVEERQDEQSLRVFHAMLVATRRRRSLPPMPFAFFQEMYRGLSPNHVALYLAVHAGEPVGGLMALKFKDMWTMEYNGDADKAPARRQSTALLGSDPARQEQWRRILQLRPHLAR